VDHLHRPGDRREPRARREFDVDAIRAEYTNGILEVRLPVRTGATVTGREIEVEG
jgi:HSP20 family protein